MRLPGEEDRLVLYGQTGTGKTNGALWHLSESESYMRIPWVILDFKGDNLIGAIKTTPLQPGAKAPTQPGLYVARPIAEVDDVWTEDLLQNVWSNGGTGLYVDEGYMIGTRSKAYNALLTQGRSKGIPMITLTQRPVWLSRFVISEAGFHQVFFLSDEADRDIVQRFIPHDITERRLPKYHSWYYDVSNDEFTGLKPLPKPAVVRDRINAGLDELKPAYIPQRPMYFI